MRASEANNVIRIVAESQRTKIIFSQKAIFFYKRVIRKGEKLCEK